MIIQRCDICQNIVSRLDTLVLYKHSIDYCDKCKQKADNAKSEFLKEIQFENTMFDNALKQKEIKCIRKLKNV